MFRLINNQTMILYFLRNFRFKCVLIVLTLISTTAFSQPKNNSISFPNLIADKYGVNSFSQISSIQFSFNVKNQNTILKRTWIWEPKTGKVTFTGADQNGKDTSITYNRDKLNSGNALELYADKRFINDQYWLLFPFHMVWDNNVDITNQGNKEFPISHKKGNSIIVHYKNNVGYTPNDAFVLYLGDDNMIKEWTYRPGGSKEKERSYTWAGNKKYGGITISTEHNGLGNKFKVWFTDISVVTDSK